MVAIAPPAKVLVTGANGYLATWVTEKYLEAGYSVRGTVRSSSKGAFLNDKFVHYGDRFELVVVEDITKDGAFDDAVKGVDAIAHIASPFHFKSTNPNGVSDFLRILTLDAQDLNRSHHPRRAGNHINPELCLEAWEHPETCDPHLFCRGGLRRRHGATCFHGRQLERCRRGGSEDERLCSRARHDLPGLEDDGREGRMEVCRDLWLSYLVGSRRPQPTIDFWGKPFFFAVYSLNLKVPRIFTALAQSRTNS